MSKTLVNIITEDNPIPAYLFIKEKYEAGDMIMYISAKDTEDDLDWLSEIDGVPADRIAEIVLKNDIDEFKYENICRTVKAYLKKDVKYLVNLAGGTRYMALAVQQVFEDFDSEFYYTNIEDNTIIKSKFDDNIYNNDDIIVPIKYHMGIAEYFRAHELITEIGNARLKPIMPVDICERMFKMFSQNEFDSRERYIMELLRESYRNRKKGFAISEIQKPIHQNYKPIPDILKFILHIGMSFHNNRLTQEQIEWITGGWFEEYMYYKIQRSFLPDEIVLGPHISRKGVKRNNELDVVFIKNNRLFVIECKTGVETERKFNEIVYKVCALKETLLGVSCHSFIASLKKDDNDSLKKIANNMDITFWDNKTITKNLGTAIKKMRTIIDA